MNFENELNVKINFGSALQRNFKISFKNELNNSNKVK